MTKENLKILFVSLGWMLIIIGFLPKELLVIPALCCFIFVGVIEVKELKKVMI